MPTLTTKQTSGNTLGNVVQPTEDVIGLASRPGRIAKWVSVGLDCNLINELLVDIITHSTFVLDSNSSCLILFEVLIHTLIVFTSVYCLYAYFADKLNI
jgi:hypothetical protein